MEIVSVPNGTKFIKPDFECKLYEEVDGVIYGRIRDRCMVWNSNGQALRLTSNASEYDLTPLTQEEVLEYIVKG